VISLFAARDSPPVADVVKFTTYWVLAPAAADGDPCATVTLETSLALAGGALIRRRKAAASAATAAKALNLAMYLQASPGQRMGLVCIQAALRATDPRADRRHPFARAR